MFQLNQKIAVITGAGSGIGREIALLFSKQGAVAIVLDMNQEQGEKTVQTISEAGGSADFHKCNVASANDVNQVFDSIHSKYSGIDILVNNAGIVHVGKLHETSEDEFDKIYQVNVKGVFLCMKAGLPSLQKKNGGVILNMASIASLIAIDDRFAYGMSKGAVLTMTKSVATDYVNENIRCNCICPSRIHTALVDEYLEKNYANNKEEMFKKLSLYQPMGRMGKPEEVAALALYLCSDEASFITGQAYPIDGGVLMK